ncbi:MAG: hypothetical protein ABIN89_14865 [Chitinophagaceae bacterium]
MKIQISLFNVYSFSKKGSFFIPKWGFSLEKGGCLHICIQVVSLDKWLAKLKRLGDNCLGLEGNHP